MVTLIPRDSRIAPRLAAAMPFPSEETTPPVTNTYLVMKGTYDVLRTGVNFTLKPYQRQMKTRLQTLYIRLMQNCRSQLEAS
jgi:hypothetical protein